MSDSQKFRDRKFVAVLYPDDPSHAAAVEKLKSGGYNFAGILHDKDVYEDGDHQGETKKAHWHIVVRFKNAVSYFEVMRFRHNGHKNRCRFHTRNPCKYMEFHSDFGRKHICSHCKCCIRCAIISLSIKCE